MADHTADSRITLHSHTWRVRQIDDFRNALELFQLGYPQRQYGSRTDSDMSKLLLSDVTHCRFKGDTTYYSLPDLDDVAWSYERPIDEMQAIAGWLAFETSKMTEVVE